MERSGIRIPFRPVAHLYDMEDAVFTSPPSNHIEMTKALSKRRGSLDDDTELEKLRLDFITAQEAASPEDTQSQEHYSTLNCRSHKLPVTNVANNKHFIAIKSLPEGLNTQCAPDRAEGLPNIAVPRAVLDAIGGYKDPGPDVPVAPNFFMEAKGPAGKLWVMKNQIFWDLFVGGRAMQRLLQFSATDPKEFSYDLECHTLGFTLFANVLTLYTVHPLFDNDMPGEGWAIFLMRAWVLHDPVGGLGVFREALTWYHNASDWALVERPKALEQAKQRVPDYEEIQQARN